MPQPLFCRLFFVLSLLTLIAPACAKPQTVARAEPAPPPPLAMPVPPPRIVVPPQPDLLPSADIDVPAVTARPRPRPLPRTESPPESPAAERPAEPAKPAEAAPAQNLELKDRDGPDESAIRVQLSRAGQDLDRVRYAELSVDLKAQYETARRFITLGGQALKEQNVVFAATLADKAGAIARLLLQR